MQGPIDEILKYTLDAILSLDHDLKVALFNPAAEQLFGYSKSEIIGQPLDILLPDVVKTQHAALMEGFHRSSDIARNMFARRPVTCLTRMGDVKSLDISIQKHPDDSPFRFSAVCRDVSPVVAMSNALAESEARLSRAQALAHIGNWEWNIGTGGLVWSNEIYRIFGRWPQDFAPTYEAFLETIHPDDRQRVSDAVDNSVANDTPYAVIHRIICPDGEEKVVQEIGEVFRDPDGNPVRMDGTVQDVTQIWQTRQELIKATDAARQAERTKSEFLSIMSHELRTPMNAILGFANLLELGSHNEDAGKSGAYAREIVASGEHLLTLIDDILHYSDLGISARTFKPGKVDPKAFVAGLRPAMERQAAEKNISIDIEIDPELAEIFVDQVQVRQIILNLTSNAIKFSEPGSSILVALRKGDDHTVVEVADRGIGMSSEEIEMIFNPFTQASMDMTRPYTGLGLGLAIVRSLADLHLGRIEVDSEPDQGATFRIRFPHSLQSSMEESPAAVARS